MGKTKKELAAWAFAPTRKAEETRRGVSGTGTPSSVAANETQPTQKRTAQEEAVAKQKAAAWAFTPDAKARADVPSAHTSPLLAPLAKKQQRDDAAVRRGYAQRHPEETGGEQGARTREVNSTVVLAKSQVDKLQKKYDAAGQKHRAAAPTLPEEATLQDARSMSPTAWQGYLKGVQDRAKTGEEREAVSLDLYDAKELLGSAQHQKAQLEQERELLEAVSTPEWERRIRDQYATPDQYGRVSEAEVRSQKIKAAKGMATAERDKAKAEMSRLTGGGRTPVSMLRGEDQAKYREAEARYDDWAQRVIELSNMDAAARNQSALGRMAADGQAAGRYADAAGALDDKAKLDEVLKYYGSLGSGHTAEEMDTMQGYEEELGERYGLTHQDFLDCAAAGDIPQAIRDADTAMTRQVERSREDLKGQYDVGDLYTYEKRVQRQAEAAKAREKQAAFAREHPVFSSAATVPMSMLQWMDLLNMDWGSGKPGEPGYIPPDASGMALVSAIQTVRGTVSKELERNTDWEVAGQNVASFLYQTGMSMADSAASITTLGPGSIYLMGANAAVNEAKDIVDRGGTSEQALWGGLAAGAAEMLFEKVSVEALLEPKSITGWGRWLRETMKQGGIEASEEVFTEIANILSDTAIMGANSEFARAVDGYQRSGLTPEEAKRQAYLDLVGQVTLAGVGGAISGMGMEGAKGGYDALVQRSTPANTSATAQNSPWGGAEAPLAGGGDTPPAGGAQNGLKTAITGDGAQESVSPLLKPALEGLQSAGEEGTIDKTSRAPLDDQEEHAVLNYKSSESYKLNEALRDGLQMSESQRQMVERMDSALPKLPTYQGQVYRRIGFDLVGREALEAFLNEHKPGSFVQYPAFTSASIEADGYPVEGDLTVTMIIQSESGRDLDGHGNDFEREIVFPRGGRFLIEQVETDADGKPVIYMKEVASDGSGQLHSEERGDAVQQVQEARGDVHLRSVPEMDPEQGVRGRVPRLRAEGDDGGQVGVGAAARGFAGAHDRLQGETPASGFHQDGENAYRQVDVPKVDFDGRAIPKSAATVMEAQATPDAALGQVQEMIASGALSFESITDKSALRRAEGEVRETGYQKALGAWLEQTRRGVTSKDLVVKGQVLLNSAMNARATEDVVQILSAYTRLSTRAAQAMQAQRVLKKLSPEWQLYAVQQSLASYQEELNARLGDDAPTVTVDQDLYDAYVAASDPREREAALMDIYQHVADQIPATFAEKWNAWRYLSMLGNPRTHIRNIVGNAGFAPVRGIKNAIAWGMEHAVDIANKAAGGMGIEKTKAMIVPVLSRLSAQDGALVSACYQDLANVEEQLLGSGKYAQSAQGQIDQRRTIFKTKALEAVRRANSTALDVEDTWFSRPVYAGALAGYLKAHQVTAQMLTEGTVKAETMDSARAYAVREAQKATYRDANAFSNLVARLGRLGEGKGKAGKVAHVMVEGVLPFKRTPANILARGVEYSPAGLVKGLSYDLAQVKNGNMTAAQAIDNISAGLTGTGLLALGFWLASMGLVTGGGSGEPEDKLRDLTGGQDYALTLPGGTSVTLDWLAPEALPFFVGVEAFNYAQDHTGGSVDWKAIESAAIQITDPVMEMSMLQGLQDAINEVKFADDGTLLRVAANAGLGYLTQGVPTIFGQIERTVESERQSTYVDRQSGIPKEVQWMLGKVMNKLPGEFSQIPYIDAWGRREETGTALERAVNNLFNPAYGSRENKTPADEEIGRLLEAGQTGVVPQRPAQSVKICKEYLNWSEYVAYAEAKGKLSYQLVSKLIADGAYKAMSDADKAKAISDAYGYANALAKKKVKPQYELPSEYAKAKRMLDAGLSLGEWLAMRTDADADDNQHTSKDELVAYIDAHVPKGRRRAVFDAYKGQQKWKNPY